MALAVLGGCAMDESASTRAACRDMVDAWCTRAFACTTDADRLAQNAPLTFDACVAQWRAIAGCRDRPLVALCGSPAPDEALDACTDTMAAASCEAIAAQHGLCPGLCPAPPTEGPLRIGWAIVDARGASVTCADAGAAKVRVTLAGPAEAAVLVPCSAYEAETDALPAGRYQVTVALIDAYERVLRSAAIEVRASPPITSVGPVELAW